jgi:hypothetical protein
MQLEQNMPKIVGVISADMVGLTPFIIHDEKNFISSEQPI